MLFRTFSDDCLFFWFFYLSFGQTKKFLVDQKKLHRAMPRYSHNYILEEMLPVAGIATQPAKTCDPVQLVQITTQRQRHALLSWTSNRRQRSNPAAPNSIARVPMFPPGIPECAFLLLVIFPLPTDKTGGRRRYRLRRGHHCHATQACNVAGAASLPRMVFRLLRPPPALFATPRTGLSL